MPSIRSTTCSAASSSARRVRQAAQARHGLIDDSWRVPSGSHEAHGSRPGRWPVPWRQVPAGGSLPMAALGAIVILAGWALIRAAGHRPGRAAAPAAQGLARAGLPLAIGILVLLGRASLDGRPNTGETGATGLARAGIKSPAGARRPSSASDRRRQPSRSPSSTSRQCTVAGGTGASWSVEALLPRYPEIGPGDLILVSGTVAPPGDDDYGAYLRQIGAAGTLRSPTLERLVRPGGSGRASSTESGRDRPMPSPGHCPNPRPASPAGSWSAFEIGSIVTWRPPSPRPASLTSSRSRAGTSRSWPRSSVRSCAESDPGGGPWRAWSRSPATPSSRAPRPPSIEPRSWPRSA